MLRSIPYLVQYPYECVEQTLNRYVPLAIVNEIYKKHPEIAKAIAAAPHRETQYEPWNKDDPRRMLMLTETPWLQQSEGGSNDSRLRDLLNPTLVKSMQEEALAKLGRAQNGSGGFPWFPGGRDDFYMTLYVLEQLSILQEFGDRAAARHGGARAALRRRRAAAPPEEGRGERVVPGVRLVRADVVGSAEVSGGGAAARRSVGSG